MRSPWTIAAGALGLAACASPTLAPVAKPPEPAVGQPSTAPSGVAAEPGVTAARDDFTPLMREVAGAYRSFGMVDNQMHWAPGLCAMPAEGVAHVSTAPAPAAHAQKVFMLYASDAAAYWRAAGVTQPLPSTLGPARTLTTRDDVLQVLVKDSFVAEHADGTRGFVGARVQPARRGADTFVPGDPIGLFVMAQLRGAPEGTDAGWIYGTITPSGEVTDAGVVAACRDCHDDEADRVFGMPLQWK